MASKRVLLAVGVLVGTIAVLAWAKAAPDISPTEPRMLAIASVEQADRLVDSKAGVVRIVRKKVDAIAGVSPKPEDTVAVVDVNHLGPLSSTEEADLRNSCMRFLDLRRREFSERRTDSSDSAALLKEATMLYELTLAEASISAIERGSCLVVDPKDPIQLTLPRAEVLTTGAMKGGSPVNVSIVMPYDAFPRLKDAREFLDTAQEFDDSETARKFNGLPDAERMAIVARVKSIRLKESPSREDLAFLRETLGFNTSLNDVSGILYALSGR